MERFARVGFTIAIGLCVLLDAFTRANSAAIPARLVTVSSQPAPNGGARLTFAFEPVIPNYTVSDIGKSAVDITFTDAAFAPGTTAKPVNALRGVIFETRGSGFVAHIMLTGTNALGVNRLGKSLDILIAGVSAQPPPYARKTRMAKTPSTGSVELVLLKYADVSEIAGIFSDQASVAAQDTFAPAPSIFGLPNASYGGVNYGGGFNQRYGPAAAPVAMGQRITANLAIDRRLNAAVLSGSPGAIAELRTLIERIDIPAPAVSLDCEVVELTRNGAENLGIDYSSSGAFASAFFLSGSGSRPQSQLSFEARVFAEVKSGNGHLLATPRVVAINGQQVTLLDGEALPVVSSQILPSRPPIVQENVSYINTGVHIDVRPRVSADGYVTSHIFAEFSNITARRSGPEGQVPQVTLRQTNTTATAKDAQPFVIGGFLHTSDTTATVRTPVLGYLPLIGPFFRVRRHSLDETNLYIIITPHILNPATQEAAYVK